MMPKEYETLLAEATKRGLEVVALGLVDGVQAMVIRDPKREKEIVVSITRDGLSCGCWHGKQGIYCVHRAFTHSEMIARNIKAEMPKAQPITPATTSTPRDPRMFR